MRRRLGALLGEADAAVSDGAWAAVAEKARAALAIETDNPDAPTYLRMADANLDTATMPRAMTTPLSVARRRQATSAENARSAPPTTSSREFRGKQPNGKAAPTPPVPETTVPTSTPPPTSHH
jgi:hypothetical protein